MKLVTVYSARETAQAHLLVDMLKSRGVPAVITDEASGALGYTAVRVRVHPDDEPRAKPLVEQFVRSASRAIPRSDNSWKCPNCGEVMEPQFTDCWNCQTPRPGGDGDASAAAAAVDVPRKPPDPHIPTDLSCLSCGYNLRTLSVDGRCPECGHPIFPSLFAKVRSIEGLSDETHFSADVLQPCLDWFEAHIGFPLEAIGFVEHVWKRALTLAPSVGIDVSQIDYDALTSAVQDLAVEFLGDPLTARRALERWNIRTSADLRRLITILIELRVLALP